MIQLGYVDIVTIMMRRLNFIRKLASNVNEIIVEGISNIPRIRNYKFIVIDYQFTLSRVS